MFHKWLFKIFILIAILTQACTKRVITSVSEHKIETPTILIQQEEYIIKKGDILKINNLNWLTSLMPEPGDSKNSGSEGIELTVSAKGEIILPEIGKYQVAGFTTNQLSDSLAYLFKDVLRNPIFDTKVISLKVKVLGAVGAQGIVNLHNESQTLGEILALSGGINFSTAGNTMQIIRGHGTSQRIIQFNFDELGDPLIMNQPVYENDIVYVPPSSDAIRTIKVQRNLVLLQPIFILMNMTVLLLNVLR